LLEIKFINIVYLSISMYWNYMYYTEICMKLKWPRLYI